MQKKGYNLPVASNIDGNQLVDLTLDILNSFLRSTKDRPFYLIFDFFRQIGITNFKNADAAELYERFKALLFGFIRQELSKLKNETDPQKANLKRRINEILKRDEYTTLTSNLSGINQIFLSKNRDRICTDLQIIPYEEILRIVEESYLKNHNRVEWCRSIFEALYKSKKYQKIINKHELVSSMIAVNIKYVEVENIQSYCSQNAKNDMLFREAEQTIKGVLPWIRENILVKFIKKNSLTVQNAAHFEWAVQLYLSDFAFSPPADLLPRYFREVMPPKEHERYLSKYKYIFETVIQKAEEEFLRRLKKSYNRQK
ncbi:MAG: hypothetical protein ABIE07_09255 [Candidatus Zixiibacteriota bacterium]